MKDWMEPGKPRARGIPRFVWVVVILLAVGFIGMAALLGRGVVQALIARPSGWTLAVYEDDARIAGADQYSAVGSIGTTAQGEYRQTYRRFSGAETIWSARREGAEYSLDYELSLESGEAKLVLIWPDDQVQVLDPEEAPVRITVPQGGIRIKAVGRLAEGVEITLSAAEV